MVCFTSVIFQLLVSLNLVVDVVITFGPPESGLPMVIPVEIFRGTGRKDDSKSYNSLSSTKHNSLYNS